MTGKVTLIFPGFQGFPGAVGTLLKEQIITNNVAPLPPILSCFLNSCRITDQTLKLPNKRLHTLITNFFYNPNFTTYNMGIQEV